MDYIICLLYSCCQIGNNTVHWFMITVKHLKDFFYFCLRKLLIKVILYPEVINTDLYLQFPFKSVFLPWELGFFSLAGSMS